MIGYLCTMPRWGYVHWLGSQSPVSECWWGYVICHSPGLLDAERRLHRCRPYVANDHSIHTPLQCLRPELKSTPFGDGTSQTWHSLHPVIYQHMYIQCLFNCPGDRRAFFGSGENKTQLRREGGYYVSVMSVFYSLSLYLADIFFWIPPSLYLGTISSTVFILQHFMGHD